MTYFSDEEIYSDSEYFSSDEEIYSDSESFYDDQSFFQDYNAFIDRSDIEIKRLYRNNTNKLFNTTKKAYNNTNKVYNNTNILDNDIEIINMTNGNIEFKNINIKNIREYKSTSYKDLICKSKDDCCFICYSSFINSSRIITLKCTHFFHNKCIIPWITKCKSCPVCRKHVI